MRQRTFGDAHRFVGRPTRRFPDEAFLQGWTHPAPSNLTILVPALNEANGLRQVLPNLPLRRLREDGLRVSVLVVDGRSTDGTQDVALSHGASVFLQAGRGKGNAIREAIPELRGEYAVMLDGDGTYPTESIVDVVRTLDQGYDVVSGTRLSGNMDPRAMSKLHRLGNRMLTGFANVLFRPKRTSDVCTGLWGFRLRALRRMKLSASGFDLEADLFTEMARLDMRYAEVPIAYRPREGDAKLSWDDGLRIALKLLRKRIAGPS